MRIAALVSRVLLGLIFLVFGLNGFLGFIHQPPPPPGVAGQYLGSLVQSHLYQVASGVEILAALMLLSGFYVPLALVLLGPVLANLLLFHILMAPSGLPPGAVCFLLWFIIFWSVRRSFAGIFQARASA